MCCDREPLCAFVCFRWKKACRQVTSIANSYSQRRTKTMFPQFTNPGLFMSHRFGFITSIIPGVMCCRILCCWQTFLFLNNFIPLLPDVLLHLGESIQLRVQFDHVADLDIVSTEQRGINFLMENHTLWGDGR